MGFCRIQVGGYLLGVKLAREVVPGAVVLISNLSGVRFRASQIQGMELQYFYVRPDWLSGVLTTHEQGFLGNMMTQLETNPRIVEPPHPLASEFAALALQPPPPNELIRRGDLLRVTGIAFGNEFWSTGPAPVMSDSRNRFESLVQRMTEAELHDHSLGELARMCGCSERHFNRLFQNHYGVNLRSKQNELRLSRAKQMLRDSGNKVIHVALESGFKHVGQFNRMFKRQFGATPSEWRQRSVRSNGRGKAGVLVGAMVVFQLTGWSAETPTAPGPGTPPPPSAVSQTNAPAKPTFAVTRYQVTGNTLLRPEALDSVLTNFTGAAVSVDQIVLAQKTLNLLYRRQGYVTVGTTLPPQKITNGVVQLQVTEGRLAEITVLGNRHFSSNNVMRAMPSLRTNQFLQVQWFNPELDRANLNSDRQIYPEIVPGPEPGTSALMLKVKDSLPLHGRLEFNNLGTPGTPNLRLNSSIQYNNLWQREHSVGFQYGFSPEQMKVENHLPSRFLDQPLVANYSAYYRMPLGEPAAYRTQAQANPAAFGFNEATRQFRFPPTTGNPELSVFASRSATDTAVKKGPLSNISRTAFLTIDSYDTGQDLTQNEGLGVRLSLPLTEMLSIKSTISAGLDYKSFRSSSFNTNNFPYTITIFDAFGVPSQKTTLISAPQPPRFTSVAYLPVSLRWDSGIADKTGQNNWFLGCAANLPVLSSASEFRGLGGSSAARNDYLTATFGVSREQKLSDDYTVVVRADGQWANMPLISNEQFGVAGTGAVRGYQDGEQFGDTGWKVSFEPRTRFYNLGMVDGSLPMRVRLSAFMDYGEVYFLESARGDAKKLWGAGFGFQGLIGQTWDTRLVLGWALNETVNSPAGSFRASFALGVQF